MSIQIYLDDNHVRSLMESGSVISHRCGNASRNSSSSCVLAASNSSKREIASNGVLLKFTPWNQIPCLHRYSSALPVVQLLQTHNYQSAVIPPGCNAPRTKWPSICALLSPFVPCSCILPHAFSSNPMSYKL